LIGFGIVLIILAGALIKMNIQFLTPLFIASGIFLVLVGLVDRLDPDHKWIPFTIVTIPYIMYLTYFFNPALFEKIMIVVLIIVGIILLGFAWGYEN